MTAKRSAARNQARRWPDLDQTSMAAVLEARDGEAVEREEAERQTDIGDGDDASRGVVELLDRLVVDEERQGDDVLGADEENDAEFVDGEQQAEAAAGEEGRERRRQDDLADDAERAGAEAARHLDLRGLDEREAREQGPHDEGRIDRDLRENDAPLRIEEIDGRQIEMEKPHQPFVQEPGRAVDESEGERDEEGRQRDEGVDEACQEPRAGERHEGDDEGEDEAEGEASRGRAEGDDDGVVERGSEERGAQHLSEMAERENRRPAGEGLAENEGERVEEEPGEDQQRRADPEPREIARRAARH